MRAIWIAGAIAVGAVLIAIAIIVTSTVSNERFSTIASDGAIYRTDRQTGLVMRCDKYGPCELAMRIEADPNPFACIDMIEYGRANEIYVVAALAGIFLLAVGFLAGRHQRQRG